MAIKRNRKRLNVWIDEDLYNGIERYAERAKVTKSYAVYVLCTYGLDYLESIKTSNHVSV